MEVSMSIRQGLSAMIKARQGGPEFLRLHAELQSKVENASSLELNGVWDGEEFEWAPSLSAPEVAALVGVLEKAKVSKVQKLNLAHNLEEGSVVALCKLLETGRFLSLEHLDLSSSTVCNVDMEGSEDIAAALRTGHFKNLHHLCMPPCHVPTVVGAMFLGGITKLRHLELEGNRDLEQRSDKMERAFKEGLLSHVNYLSLCNCSLEAAAVEPFAEAIESGQMDQLSHLNLSWNAIREKGSESLARLLRSGHLKSLQHLNLGRCEIRDGGMRVIVKAIDDNTVPELKYLNVEENGIGDEGVKELKEAMEAGHLRKLQTLIIQMNWIGEKGMVALAHVLERGHCGSLKQLYIFEVKVSEASARAWVSAFVNNDALTVDLVKFRWPNTSYKTNAERYRKRNLAVTAARRSLRDEKDVPATKSKVFLCGFPEVGKTTLRMSLARSRVKSVVTRELKHRHEPRTRGIEVSHVRRKGRKGRKSVNLAIWDMAGQPEYYVLHSAFSLAEGKATIFVIVLDSSFNRAPDRARAEEELHFWLRFVASSCVKGDTRHVLIALNHFDRRKYVEIPQWLALITDYKKKFDDLLKIHEVPFDLDARLQQSVAHLRTHLMDLSLELLEGVMMPGICRTISESLSNWTRKNKSFPVQTLDEFLLRWQRSDQDHTKLIAAVEFLHEAGEIVYFRKDTLRELEGNGMTSLLVLDPDWICHKVVGNLLLPDILLDVGETSMRSLAERDGSILLRNFLPYVHNDLRDDHQVEYVKAMLMHLGLCYEVGSEKVLIPPLIAREDTSKWEEIGVGRWEHNPEQWVMGRSLTLKDTEKTLLPEYLFRRLQVALQKKFGSPDLSDYVASKSSSTFKARGMIVLIQFDVNDKDPKDDRIDILVKSLVPSQTESISIRRKLQVDFVVEIMDLIEHLSICYCPGIQFEIKVIIPWKAADPTPLMHRRTLVSLDIFRTSVEEHGLGERTDFAVGEDLVMEEDLLSTRDLQGLQITILDKCAVLEEDLAALDFDVNHEEQEQPQDVSSDSNYRDLQPEIRLLMNFIRDEFRLNRKAIHDEGRQIRLHLGQWIAELRQEFTKIFENTNLLLAKVQALQSYSIQEQEKSLPRFMFLKTPAVSSRWIKLRDACFLSSVQLHLLCEARFKDGLFHEVEGQEGIQIKNPKRWVRKLRPWLIWSLKMMIIVAKVAGGAVIPGLGIFLPTFPSMSGENIANFVEDITMLAHDELTGMDTDNIENGPAQEFPAAAVLKDLLSELGHAEFVQKIGLRKAVLKNEDGSPKSVAWICKQCFQSYKSFGLAIDITP